MSETTPRRSDQINELAAALAKAQAAMENPTCDRENTFFNNSPYATLSSVRNAIVPHLAANGLSIVQTPKYTEGFAGCEWLLIHSSGQWLSGELMVPITKKDAQGVGAAVTYCRRFTMQSVAGVVGEVDDDGNKAVEGTQTSGKKAPTEKATGNKRPEDTAATGGNRKSDAKKDATFIPEYEPLSKFFHSAGCKSAEEASTVAKFCCHTANLEKAQKNAAHAKEIYAGIELALVDHKTPEAILEAAKALAASTPV